MGSVKSKKTAEGVCYNRRAHYAGSWYEDDADDLDATLTKYLREATSDERQDEFPVVRGMVCPHAGYSYSGPTAAYAYRNLTQALQQQQEADMTILVLHPSHYAYLKGCAVSGAQVIETPLGNIPVNETLQQEVLALSGFSVMTQSTDEQEHSGELQYPYIAKACKDSGRTCKILPIMIGSINESQEENYGKLLAPIVARPNVITVVSSDFCHWGSRFQYTPFADSRNIFDKIQEMDQTGMNHIEMQEPGAFCKYIRETRNTICGRHPIAVWLQAVKHNKVGNVEALDIKFVKYAQSSQVRSRSDSSVSYASAVARQASCDLLN